MLNLLKSRRSIRKYKNNTIEKDKIDTIIKCAFLSPSSRSLKPWEFIVVDQVDTLSKLALAKKHGSSFLANAPIAIVIIGDSKKCDVWIEELSIASIIIQLTAHDLGLGSCWIQIRERLTAEDESSSEYVKKILNVPSNYEVECIVSIGYPDEEKKPYDEVIIDQKLHFNRFTN